MLPYNKNYVLSLQYKDVELSDTLSFEEATNGWVSFYDYKPNSGFSSQGKFFTTNGTAVWEHYSSVPSRNQFYGAAIKDSILKFVFNPDPTRVKTFKTVNYEGTNGWEITSLISDATGFDARGGGWDNTIDTSSRIWSYDEGLYTENNILCSIIQCTVDSVPL